jgi:SAM-dependent methyltransferase
MAPRDWISFYNARHSLIYVNDRHRDVHYRTIAQDVSEYVPDGGNVMDYGCGEATSADLVATRAGHLSLVEAASNVRASLTQRFGSNPNISVLTPDEAAANPDGSFDLIVLHSVAQYLKESELDGLLILFRRLLRPGALLIVGDIVPEKLNAPLAAISLLRFAAANGFLVAAVGGLIRIVVSDYLTLKGSLGLTHYDEAAMLKKLREAGFVAARAETNIGHNQWRMTFLARRA